MDEGTKKMSIEGEAPRGCAAGGGDASPIGCVTLE
jgi:hypothetical protein